MAADHVVIGAQSNDHSAHLAGVPIKRFFTDARLFTRVQLLVSEYYGFDAALNFRDVYNVEADANNAFITAGVDAKLLQNGPVEAIVERIKLYIDQLARDGRCMIHLNQIPAETPPDHIHAAVAACRACGRLPIAADLNDVRFEVPKRESFEEFLRAKGESVD
jgi:uroporphyrinogen-III decarboxylase